MAHELEIVNGKAQMAYVGAVPWHGLGVKVPADLTPEQMLDAAGLNWSVEKIPAYANVGGKNVKIGQSALVRDRDNKILDVVSDDWNPVQNAEAFDFFNEFVAAGDMEHLAGESDNTYQYDNINYVFSAGRVTYDYSNCEDVIAAQDNLKELQSTAIALGQATQKLGTPFWTVRA